MEHPILTRLSGTPLAVEEALRFVGDPAAGAVATFVGTARVTSSVHPGQTVVRLEYEAYPEMASPMLETIARAQISRGDVLRICLLHRIGTVAPGEPSIVVAVSAAHRAAAFEACRAAVEAVKARLPVWKKEVYADGTAWVGAGA